VWDGVPGSLDGDPKNRKMAEDDCLVLAAGAWVQAKLSGGNVWLILEEERGRRSGDRHELVQIVGGFSGDTPADILIAAEARLTALFNDPAMWKATEAVAAELQEGRYVEEDHLRYIVAEAKGEPFFDDDEPEQMVEQPEILGDEMAAYIAALVGAYPAVKEIWLLGSRANGSHRPDSDWDFLVFANQRVLNSLTRNSRFKRPDVDLLVVYDGDKFCKPWRDPKKARKKRGSLSGWEWKSLSDEATYKATKESAEDEFYVDITKGRAVRVWPRRS
jgi:predicted nucleotidyltransferase